MKNIFTQHPQSVGETYFQHFRFAGFTGLKLILWGFIAIIHALFPFLFKTYVSSQISTLYHKITKRN